MTAHRTPQGNECHGSPEGFFGGELEWCCAPTKSGRRFCDRCQEIRVTELRARVTGLLEQYHREFDSLQRLIKEGELP